MIITGTGHTITHFVSQYSKNPYQSLLDKMAETKIASLANISVLDFHNGFSISMGILLIGVGIQILLAEKKTAQFMNLLTIGAIVLISVFYFPPFVIALTGISFICLFIHAIKYKPAQTV
ncbi:hypothetical protein AUTU_14110 [Aureibacter tunicatorum]|nr:hypothetical protein AUTU_14110 [Aureibacter tunicatorum]